MQKFWRGNLDLTKPITIIGGGISGLLAAYHFKKKSIPFQLIESSHRVGGKLSSIKTEFGIIESAANAVLATPKIRKFLEDLDLNPIESRSKLKRNLYINGKLKTFPFLTPQEIISIIPRIFKKTPIISNKSSLLDFWSPLLGRENTQDIIHTALQGIYGSSVQNLSFKNISSINFPFGEKNYFSYFKKMILSSGKMKSVSFEGGLQSLVDALYEEVKDHVLLNQQINSPAENSLICTPSHIAADLTGEVFLKSIENINIYSHTIVLNKPISKLKGSFGVLFEEAYRPFLGMLCNKEIFPIHAKDSFTIISSSKVSTTQILDSLKNKNFITDHEVIHSKSFEWTKGLPVYGPNLNEIWECMDNSKYAFFGNYTDKISLRALIEKTI